MQITIELPDILGEKLKTVQEPNNFILNMLTEVLEDDSQSSIEDAFGLYNPKNSVSLEDMEQVIEYHDCS